MSRPEPCIRIQDLLSDYLEGLLDGHGAERVRGHLRLCAGCREAFEGLEASLRSLKQAPRVPAGPGFKEAVLARSGAGTKQSPSAERRLFRWAALAASLVVALTAVRNLKPAATPPPRPTRPVLPPPPAPAPAPGLRLSGFEGRADRLPSGGTRWIPLDGGAALSEGDVLRTGPGGASLQVGEHPVPLPPGSITVVEKAEDGALRLAYFARRAELDQEGSLQVLRLLEREGSISLVRKDGSVGMLTEGPPEPAWSKLEEIGFTRPLGTPKPAEPDKIPKTSKEF